MIAKVKPQYGNMTSGGLQMVTGQYEPEKVRELDELALKDRRSRAFLLRDALDLYLAQRRDEAA